MHALRLWPAAAALALLAGCGLGAPAYPTFGENAYRLEGTASTPDGRTVPTVVYRDGPKMRVETTLANNAHAVIVFDQATNAAYVLNATATPTAAPASAIAPAAPTGATTITTTPAGATTTTIAAPPPPQIIGVATRIASADAPTPLEASWSTLGADHAQNVGTCEAAGASGHEWRPREDSAGVERTACITDDGIVLRLREGNRVLFQATRLDVGPQSASLFGVPPGYQVIDPSAVAEQVGDTMQNLDSVNGAAPARPAAAAPTPRPNG